MGETMSLTVKERAVLFNALPAQGDFLTMKTVRDLREAVNFSDEEQTALKFHLADGQMRWDPEAAKGHLKDIEIGPRAHVVISDRLRELDKQKKLTADQVPLYERFVQTE